MKLRFLSTFMLAICTLCSTTAQIAMGAWRTHISYINTTQITQSTDKVYGISAGALFSVYKHEPFIETYSKSTGLNDNNVHIIKYSEKKDVLLIAYYNSNIDLLTNDGLVINIPDLHKKSMSGSKKINDICFNDKYAYLACDFGILVFNIDKQEFFETYNIGKDGEREKIININIVNDSIYALTSNDIWVASLKSNMQNFQNWTSKSNPDIAKKNIGMTIKDGQLFLLKENNIVYTYKDEWKIYKNGIKKVSVDNNVLFLTDTNDKLYGVTNGNEEHIANNAVSGLFDENNNTLWYIADGAIYKYEKATGNRNAFAPNGPISNTSWRLKYADGRIFTIPGGRWDANYYTNGSLSFFDNGIWYNYVTNYFIAHTETNDRCFDLVDIAIDPTDKTHFFVASYGLGLYEFRNDNIYKFHHCDNSGLIAIEPKDPYNYTRTDGMTFDSKGNLWILNNGGDLIKYIDRNGEYHSMPYNISAYTPQDILICNKNENQKFVLIPRHKGTTNSILFSFDDNATLDNQYDDKSISLTKVYDQDNKEINFYGNNLLRCITQDKNGVVWIGTTSGVFLINDPKKIFNNDFKAYRIKIPRNDGTGLADYLLGTEEIKAIVVDGANRKWIGTAASGVYLVSEDGQEIIHHFSSENSPLLSNAIQSITINDKTGEVFFGTGNGLISYQSDAIEGGNKFENVHAYPNPVRPEYTGLITITGLVADTNVRITDVNGNIIYETISNGGAATWNGCNASGERVASGVYFAQCISPNGKYKHITKILVIK